MGDLVSGLGWMAQGERRRVAHPLAAGRIVAAQATMKTRRITTPSLGTSRERVTVTLRPESLAYADRKARERQVSRSEVIDAALAEAEERDFDALMIAGYKAMARENAELAERMR